MAILAMHAPQQDSPVDEQFATWLADQSRQLREDENQLRAREQSLREYEARLRALQTQIDASRDIAAYTARQRAAAVAQEQFVTEDAATLGAAWQKLYRTLEIFEAEQISMMDERQAVHELGAELKAQLAGIMTREARIAEREAEVHAATAPAEAADVKSGSIMSRIFGRL